MGARTTRPKGDVGRLRQGIIDACHASTDGDEFVAEMSRRMQPLVPFDSSLWFGTDPDTLLASCPTRVENVEVGHCATYWEREFMVEDAILYRDLARAPQPVQSLHSVTGGQPGRSARWREFLAPQGYDDELRAAARVGQSTWGFLSLTRTKGRPPFSPEETALVASLTTLIGEAFRSRWLYQSAPATAPSAPGLLMLDRTGAIVSLNDQAEAWLDHLPYASSPDGLTHSTGVWNVVARAWAGANGREPGTARLRLRSRSGQWLILHASTLKGSRATSQLTAVMIEPAQAAEIAPIIVQAYGFTPRELDITHALARGFNTTEIANSLFLSAHTVRDHIKTIFGKVGVKSRGELIAQLFAEHYAPEHLRTAQQLEL